MTAPTLRVLIGTAGSGKSTIAQRLAREGAAAYLDKDAMSTRFVEAALLAAGYDPGDLESNAFYRNASCRSSTTRSSTSPAPTSASAARSSSTHRSACTCQIPHFITEAAKRFDWPPVDVEVVGVRVSPETLRHRLRERGLKRDRFKLAHWDEYWATHGGRPCAWAGVRVSKFLNDSSEGESRTTIPSPERKNR